MMPAEALSEIRPDDAGDGAARNTPDDDGESAARNAPDDEGESAARNAPDDDGTTTILRHKIRPDGRPGL